MKSLSSFINSNQKQLIFIVFFFFFLTRLANLNLLPIFTDEAIYIRWSQIGSFDAAWRFIPLTDGKPPLYHWLVMAAIRLIPDPLIAGRLVSVFAGSLNLILIGLIAHFLFRRFAITFFTLLFYTFSPFAVVYDRLAIVDSLLTTFSLSSFLFAVWLAKSNRLDAALLLGASVGAGLLTKTSGLLFLFLSPFTLLLRRFPPQKFKKALLRWILLFFLAVLISQMIYSILRLSQFFYRIGQKNLEFIIPLLEFFRAPFSLTWGNAKSLFRWQVGYLSIPMVLLVIFSFSRPKYFRQKLLLFAYYAIPFLLIASFNKIIFPRFLLFSHPYLLLLAATGLVHLLDRTRSTLLKLLLSISVLAIPTYTTFTWISNPAHAAIPQADRDQYYDSWPAGHGIGQTVAYLKAKADQEPIYIGTQGTFGLLPYALEIYLINHPNVEIHSFWPVTTVPKEVLAASARKTTYFIYNELEDIPPQENLELIFEFPKYRGQEVRHMRLFKVNPILP